ncbi:GPI ethanolamine phosphate transferas-like protein [Lineolata rhizophorae]|uniref:GPI ethanolamine phosphate transferase 1 n=1 Tax=Lineolata rhizophorae TaxID=578093 RepID=A0A6A6NUP0_9PEZI|nr:GPI ethanolamine phosphate transferas-like protein [Lineolata rhizophorae]
MARLSRHGFLAIAVFFHLLYVYSIFDIYFVSPIVSGMRAFKVETEPEPPAKRLVLFVGDGLRADKAFQYHPDPSPASTDDAYAAASPRPLAPYLRSRVLSHGTFGVSHTRVPTESRPGHVALIAGLYEDVSAVTTGWKLNPVNFDSVFNRSRHTWSWGSPDILPMFAEGAVPGRVDQDMYGAEAEDFTQDATSLDTWVFDRVRQLFTEDTRKNVTLDKELRQEGNVFFLHLLGLDTTGHFYRPYSKEYLHNIKVVDSGVQEIVGLVEDFFDRDGRTAFVFTADHGMSDWGSHGDGHPDNTRTPLIAWGAGVAPPVLVPEGQVAPGHEDGFSADWHLDRVQRNDVAQADVATLMAYLAGLEFPVNSVGELPLAYVAAGVRQKAEALLVNARQILEMYAVKEAQKQAHVLRYVPFPGFREDGENGGVGGGSSSNSANASASEQQLALQLSAVERRFAAVRDAIDNGRYDDAITQSEDLIQLALAGLRYLQTYDWLFLRALVTAGYLGWIAFATATVIDLHVLQEADAAAPIRRNPAVVGAFAAALAALFAALFIQQSPWTYYAYAVFPVAFWEEVLARREALVRGSAALLAGVQSGKQCATLVAKTVAFVALLEALVASYFRREIYTACYLAGAAWPILYGVLFVKSNPVLVATWMVCCVLMSSFTLLPVVKVESITQILLGGFLMFAVGAAYLLFEKSILVQSEAGAGGVMENGSKDGKTKSDGRKGVGEGLAASGPDGVSRSIIGVQIGLVALAMLVTRSSVASLQAREGLPLGTQIVGWIVLVASLTVPFLHGLRPNNHYLHRLMVIFLSFSPVFIILTTSYEGLFYFSFCATLVTWVRMEHRIYTYTSSTRVPNTTKSTTDNTATGGQKFRPLTLADARIALFFLYLLQSAFFSTGNIASVSSFSLDAVSRLIPVFDPFSQGALLMLKILLPFAVISANLGILNRRLGVAPSALFMVVMAIGDALTLNFFFMVRDEGSWLDIGTSISHFCIASGLSVFVAGLELVSEVFVSGVEFEGGAEMLDGKRDGRAEVSDSNGSVRVKWEGDGIGGSKEVAANALDR